jgi:hypothetical protein
MKILNRRFKAAQLSLVHPKPNPNPWFNTHPAGAPFHIHAPIWHRIQKPNEDFESKIQGRTTFISAPKANIPNPWFNTHPTGAPFRILAPI